MMQAVILVLAYALMLAGPLLQGLAGNTNPNAYIFAAVMLAGAIPQIAGRNIAPNPLTMVLALLICGGLAMGLWYLGTMFGPFAIAAYLPVACAVAGAALAAGGNLLRRRGA